MKSLKLSNYFELVNPTYKYIQITSHKSIRNYNSDNISKMIAHTYKSLDKRMRREQKKIFFETSFKISYVMDIKDKNCNFYFIVPSVFLNGLLEKISEIWSKSTVNIFDENPIEPISKDAEMYQLSYKKEDALSLQCDKKSNEPLNSLLSVMDILKEQDRIMIIYNFLPISQFSWLDRYNGTMTKLKDNKLVDKKQTSVEYIFKSSIMFISNTIDSLFKVIDDFTGGKAELENKSLYDAVLSYFQNRKENSISTKKKKEATVLDVQIAVVSESNDSVRKINNITSVCQSYRVLDEDNMLVYKKFKKKARKKFKDMEQTDYNIDYNTMSTEEVGSTCLQIPGKSILTQFGIKHVNIEEVKIPEKLRKGYISFGINRFKGTAIATYIEDEYNISALPLLAVGQQGSGKSTFISNFYKMVNKRKEGGVVIDYIKNCELAKALIKALPKEDVIVLDYSDNKNLQSFAFNEFDISKVKEDDKKVELANLQAQQVLSFVDAINPLQPLQARMRKYLSGAANVVFATGENSLKAVVTCLEDFKERRNYIDKLTPFQKELLSDEIKYLEDLDEYSKPTKADPITEVIGTFDSKIEGILDRISLLKEDFKLKYMFNKNGKDNINFADELEKGKIIIIKMPQDKFKKHVKNVVTTFLLSKIWIATEIRGTWNERPRPTNICVDEIFQTKTAMAMLANDDILPQTRKFGCKFFFSCQGTDQIDILLDTLINAGATFMFMRGTSEKDFNKFKNDIKGLEYEDLQDMCKTYMYPSLNLVNYSDGKISFITELPPKPA